MAITKNPVATEPFISSGDLSIVTAKKGVQSLDLRTMSVYTQQAQPQGSQWVFTEQIVLPTSFIPDFITAVADTATINLTVNPATSTLTADFTSMDISQFTNNVPYLVSADLEGVYVTYSPTVDSTDVDLGAFSLTVPLVIGGTGASSDLVLRATSGVGGTAAEILMQVGNNGALEGFRIDSIAGAAATGGTITFSGGFVIHTFTSSGTFTPAVSLSVDALVVAGGAGGGAFGGGGAGGFRTTTSHAVTAIPYAITVGTGGAGGTAGNKGASGTDSTFDTITSAGGGGGGAFSDANATGVNGGSGGGGGTDSTAPFTARAAGSGNTPVTVPSQGNDGGIGVTGATAAGGGGGSSAVGGNGVTTTGGAGGAGTSNSFSGAAVTYAGGGGGAGQVTGGAGGSGGGGAGGASAVGANATGFGSGGGGGYNTTGGNGSDGIVIIRYMSPSASTRVVTSIGGVTSPEALLHLAAGDSNPFGAPLKFSAGDLLTIPELGAMEFTDDGVDGHLYLTLSVASVLTRVQII